MIGILIHEDVVVGVVVLVVVGAVAVVSGWSVKQHSNTARER